MSGRIVGRRAHRERGMGASPMRPRASEGSPSWLRWRDGARAGRPCRVVFAGLVFLLLSGCFAPRERLAFPRGPIERDGTAEWYDVTGDGRRDFAITYDASGRVDELL